MKCVKGFKFKDYKPIELKPYEVLIGNSLDDIITVNMNTFPHILIGGDVGSGKSRLLLTMLTNLITNSSKDIEIHLLQVRKSDLSVFQGCDCVRTYSKTLDEVLNSLQRIDNELQRREKLIDNTKGYYSIIDYNEDHKAEPLKYIYVVIDEFSFLCGKEDAIKTKCLNHIKSIAFAGRSSGVFLMISLQKPTANDKNIPTDIRSQLTTRIAMKLLEPQVSQIVIDNGDATKLKPRQFIVRTSELTKGYTMTIDHKTIENALKPFKGGYKPYSEPVKVLSVKCIKKEDIDREKAIVKQENIDRVKDLFK